MLNERHQMLFKIETSDGTPATPGVNDGVLVYEPKCDDDPSFLDRRPSGRSLSQQFKPPGLKMRRMTFKSDVRGSGAVGTAPEWSKLARACSMRETNLISIAMSSVAAAERFMVGQLVYQGTDLASATAVGICVTDLRGANGTVLISPISGTFSNTTTKAITIDASGAEVVTASATAAAPTTSGVGFGYLPDSERIMQLSVNSWTGPHPDTALGAILTITDTDGHVKGAAQIVSGTSGGLWDTTFQVQLLFGSVANGDLIGNTALAIGAVNAVPLQTRGVSLTGYSNVDGFARIASGMRGTFSMDGEAGSNFVFSWDMLGKPQQHLAQLAVATGVLNTVRPPRLFGAFAGFRTAAGFFKLPISKIAHNQGNTVGPREDVNQPGGSLGTFVTARKPVTSIEFEDVNLGFDVIKFLDEGTLVGFGCVVGGDGSGTHAGRTAGNTCVFAVPQGQIIGLSDGEKNGVKTWNVEIEAQGVLGAGDDELVIASF